MDLYLYHTLPGRKEKKCIDELENLIGSHSDVILTNVEYWDKNRSIGEVDVIQYRCPLLWLYELKSNDLEKNRLKAEDQLRRANRYIPGCLQSRGYIIDNVTLIYAYMVGNNLKLKYVENE